MERVFEPLDLRREEQEALDVLDTAALKAMLEINRARIEMVFECRGTGDPGDHYYAASNSFTYARELEMRCLEQELGLHFDHRKPPAPWVERRTVSALRAEIECLTPALYAWIKEASTWEGAQRVWVRDQRRQTVEINAMVALITIFKAAREIERKEHLCDTDLPCKAQET